MSKPMARCWIALLLSAALLHGTAMWGEGDARRTKVKVQPTYPELARELKLVGTVRLEVVVASNGTVKSTRALGGHPLLIQAASEAMRKWRYEPGPESTIVVEFHFHSQ